MADMTRTIALIGAILPAGALAATLVFGGFGAFQAAAEERNTTEQPPTETVLQATIPPIEAAAPTETETATFALG